MKYKKLVKLEIIANYAIILKNISEKVEDLPILDENKEIERSNLIYYSNRISTRN